MTKPKVLLLDEPTRGIDVGAKEEIYLLINELAASGLAVVVISSELPELMGISDRIITICEGVLTGEISKEEATQEKLLTAATNSNSRRAGGGDCVRAKVEKNGSFFKAIPKLYCIDCDYCSGFPN